jgi:hypothetical protein
MQIDFVFPHEYEVAEIGDYPGDGKFRVPVHFFPPPEANIRHGALWLKVIPNDGQPWIGAFAFAYNSPPAASCVVSTPDPRRLCVISNGGGYLVQAADPANWHAANLFPILDVRAVVEKKLLLFSDFTAIAAYGPAGLLWRSPQVCWDALKITKITDAAVEGVGYDPTNRSSPEMRFSVDLKTGRSLLHGPTSINGRPVW